MAVALNVPANRSADTRLMSGVLDDPFLGEPVWAWIVWVLGGVATAWIASRKGRSVVGWGILGLIFSVIAVIVVAVLPKPDRNRIPDDS